MYRDYYQLSADPFSLSPDPRFVYAHPQYQKVHTTMIHALDQGDGIMVITGRSGTGKTTLAESFLKHIKPNNICCVSLESSHLETSDILRMIGYQFGVDAKGLDKATLLFELQKQLTHHARGLLIIDEAQNLSVDSLEELRMLTNMHAGPRPLLQIFLVGQEELHDRLHIPELEQLHQRIVATCALEPLTLEDTKNYILHRLQCANWQNNPAISTESLILIHRFSQGLPRYINKLCSRLFLHGMATENSALCLDDVVEVVREFRDELLLPLPTEVDSKNCPSMPGIQDLIDRVGLPVHQRVDLSNAELGFLEQEPESIEPTACEQAPETTSVAARVTAPEAVIETVTEAAPETWTDTAPLAESVMEPQPYAADIQSSEDTSGTHENDQQWNTTAVSANETTSHTPSAKSSARIVKGSVRIAKGSVREVKRSVQAIEHSGKALLRHARVLSHAALKGIKDTWHNTSIVGPAQEFGLKSARKLVQLWPTWNRELTYTVTASATIAGVALLTLLGNPAVDATVEKVTSGQSKPRTNTPLTEESTTQVPDAYSGTSHSSTTAVAVKTSPDEQHIDSSRNIPVADEVAADLILPVAASPHQGLLPVTNVTMQHSKSEALEYVFVDASVQKIVLKQEAPNIAETEQELVENETDLRKQQIEDLVQLGNNAIDKDRLRFPEEKSAWTYFRKIQKLSPNDPSVALGLNRIAQRYAELANEVLEEDDTEKAALLINRGLGVVPEHETLTRMQHDMERKQAELIAAQESLKNPFEVEIKASPKETEENPETTKKPGNLFSALKKIFVSEDTQTLAQVE